MYKPLDESPIVPHQALSGFWLQAVFPETIKQNALMFQMLLLHLWEDYYIIQID